MNPCCWRGPGSIGGAPAGWTPSKAADRRWAVISGWDSPRGSVDPGLGLLLLVLVDGVAQRAEVELRRLAELAQQALGEAVIAPLGLGSQALAEQRGDELALYR